MVDFERVSTGWEREFSENSASERRILNKKPNELPEWKKHYLENRNKSVEEKRLDQHRFMVDLLKNMKSLFGSLMLSALRKVERETLSEQEMTTLLEHQEANELLLRIKGLKKEFPSEYYNAVDAVMGENTFKEKTELLNEEDEKEEEAVKKKEAQAVARLPKGYSKWNLKQIKLNESLPEKGKNIWIEFFALKGETAVGRILYNEAKDLLYFRPHDVTVADTFPLTMDQGRKLTREGHAYYFKKAGVPAGEV